MYPLIADIHPRTHTRRLCAARPGRAALGLTLLICGLAGLGAAGAASAAGSEEEVRSMVVRYDAHSLDTEQGARVLYRRIVMAAAEVCPQEDTNPHWISDAVRKCREQSIARAVRAIDSPRLVAVHAATAKQG